MKMRNILLVAFVALTLTGCSVLPSFLGGSSKPVSIPMKPTRGFEDVEKIKSNVGVIVDISQVAYTSGVNAYTHESETLLKSAKVLQTISGLPTDQIDWRIKEEVEKLHSEILYNEREYRIERAEWEADIASMADEKAMLKNKNSKLSSALDSFKFWFWFSVIALGVLTFLCPTIGIPLIKFLVGRAKNLGEKAVVETASALKGQFGQVVDAIEDFKNDEDIDEKTALKLKEYLSKKTDSETRKIINEAKHK